MDWLQFISAIIGHLAWPIVILILLIMVRKQIHSLAERLLEFSFGGAKVTFDKILQKGAEIIQEAPLTPLPKPADQPELKLERPSSNDGKRNQIAIDFAKRRRERKQVLDASGFGQVLSGLEEIDNLLYEIGDEMGIDAADPSSILYTMISQERLPERFADLYRTLRDARTVVAHSPQLPDAREALEYSRQIDFLRDQLQMYRQHIYSDNFSKEKPPEKK